jgi:DNA repair protein RadA/Sms
MAKAQASARSTFRCQQCGHVEPKWLGRCPACQEWNSLVEENAAAAAPRGIQTVRGAPTSSRSVSVTEAQGTNAVPRLHTGIGEIDRVLGGGLVPGSLVLLAGDPGIGKSTLLLQALDGLAAGGRQILYVSGEESVAQTGLRARRLGVKHGSLRLYAETSLERILGEAESVKPQVLAVDSIQTIFTETIDGIPGSVGQVRECAARLQGYAKTSGVPVILVGHVTKDGTIAGPKTLEHVVDAVLHFEGEGTLAYRVLRGLKNRFGSTAELGVFSMRQGGLVEVKNPSEMLLAERPVGAPGSVVVASADGARPLLVEVQSLVAPAAAGFGRRTADGVDTSRVALLIAVLAERAGCNVLAKDVFVNVAGGIRLSEPAVDLGIACAIASAERRVALPPRTLVFGEVGLAGEVRGVTHAELRLAEAAKLGFERVILPKQNQQRVEGNFGIELVGVQSLRQALGALLQAPVR